MGRWNFNMYSGYEDVPAWKLRPGDVFEVLLTPQEFMLYGGNTETHVVAQTETLLNPDELLIYCASGFHFPVNRLQTVRRAVYLRAINSYLYMPSVPHPADPRPLVEIWQAYHHIDVDAATLIPNMLIWMSGDDQPRKITYVQFLHGRLPSVIVSCGDYGRVFSYRAQVTTLRDERIDHDLAT